MTSFIQPGSRPRFPFGERDSGDELLDRHLRPVDNPEDSDRIVTPYTQVVDNVYILESLKHLLETSLVRKAQDEAAPFFDTSIDLLVTVGAVAKVINHHKADIEAIGVPANSAFYFIAGLGISSTGERLELEDPSTLIGYANTLPDLESAQI